MTEVTASLLYPAVYKFLLDANLKSTATALKQEANLIKFTPKSVINDNLLEIYRTYLNNKTNGVSKKRKREVSESEDEDEDEDTNKMKQQKKEVTQISSVKATPLNKSVPTPIKKQIEKQDDSDDTDESDSDSDSDSDGSNDNDKGKKPETNVTPKVSTPKVIPKVIPKVTPKVFVPIKNAPTTKPTETSKIVPKSLPEVKKPQVNDDEDDEEDKSDKDNEEDEVDEKDKTDKNIKAESKQNGNFKMNETSANNQNGKQNNKRKGNHSFQRIDTNIDDLRPELRDNSFHVKDETYGAKANRDLSIVKGKGFRHEKTKKKRGTYKSGGHIDSGKVNSVKFD